MGWGLSPNPYRMKWLKTAIPADVLGKPREIHADVAYFSDVLASSTCVHCSDDFQRALHNGAKWLDARASTRKNTLGV